MPISKKMQSFMEKASLIRRMFEEGARLKAEYGTENVFDFSLGNPNLPPPEAFQECLLEYVREERPMKHGYMPNAGYPEVRRSVAKHLVKEQGVELDENDIIMTCGAGGGLNVTFKSILNPGSTVICPSPYFVEYFFYTDNHGGTLVTVPCKEDFDIDIEGIASKITRDTACVLVNSPCNPTGKVYPKATIDQLARMLREKAKEVGHPIYLVSDEPYRKIVYGSIEVPSVIATYENSIMVTSYSKDLSLAGERIGFIAVNPKAEDAKMLVNAMILSNRILGFVNAPATIQQVVGRVQGVSVDINEYKRKRDLLCKGLASIGYKFHLPEGAFYLFPRSLIEDDMAFCNLLKEERILAVPGRAFGAPGYFRLAYCIADSVIEHAIPGFRRVWERVMVR